MRALWTRVENLTREQRLSSHYVRTETGENEKQIAIWQSLLSHHQTRVIKGALVHESRALRPNTTLARCHEIYPNSIN